MDKIKKVLKIQFYGKKEVKTESNLNKMYIFFDPAIGILSLVGKDMLFF